jgi:hypothetical protein
MAHRERTDTTVRKGAFNTPMIVKWRAELGPEVEGIRDGKITLGIGASERSVSLDVVADKGTLCFDVGMQGREHSRARTEKALDAGSMPSFARKFLDAVKRRLESEWGKHFKSLVQSGGQLAGSGQITVMPSEWGQDKVETLSVPYARIVSVPMGGMNRRH